MSALLRAWTFKNPKKEKGLGINQNVGQNLENLAIVYRTNSTMNKIYLVFISFFSIENFKNMDFQKKKNLIS